MIFLKKFKKFSLILIFLVQLIPNIDIAFGAETWCIEHVPVRKTRTVWRHGTQMVTRRTWLGYVKNEWRPHTYTEQENYYDFERQRKCCSGYKLYYGDCKPICSPECPSHSDCDEPNICKCESGYEGIRNYANSLDCNPICTKGCPFYSTCTAPNVCTCNAGYKVHARGSTCEPICEDGCSENSTCTAPDKCSCNEGYATKADGTCEPICVNSCPANSWCDAPNHCSCNAGYLMDASQTCKPNCELGCPAFSNCLAPEHCECETGYRMNENATLCEPQCGSGCPERSVCLLPQHCQCDEGYRMQTQLLPHPYCEPICEMDCSVYGKCVRPGVCECLPGYEMSESVECRPRCTKGCAHGFCFAPEICVCNPGYLMGPNSTCEATCSLGCVNGKCVEPEICACAEGYRFQEKSVHVCEPICEPACERADCVAPDMCICWNRHQPAAENASTICEPICPSECVHGHCNASFECSCDEGYVEHSYLSNECVPRCENCENGDCSQPDECNCWPGYSYRKGEIEQCVWLSAESTTEYGEMEAESMDGWMSAESTTEYAETEAESTSEYAESEAESFSDYGVEESSSVGGSDEISELTTSTTSIYLYADTAATLITVAINDETAATDVDFITKLVTTSHCELQCKCWAEIDEFGAINTDNCLEICADDVNEQRCLNVTLCLCDLHRLELVCNSNDVSYKAVSDGTLYKCQVRNLENSKQRPVETTKDHDLKWWLIGGILSGLLVLTALIYLGWRLLKTAPEEGDYDVVYQDGKASVRA